MRQHLASGHSAARCLAGIFLALICLLPASCTDSRDTITVGSKNFGESNVLAQMFAILIREHGIPVAGPIEYPTTQSRSEEHTSELQSLIRISNAVYCLK